VTGFLRFLGIANVAVWFGAAIFFTFAVGPGIFSEEMRAVLGANPSTFEFYAGGVALVIIKRYFILQNVCGLLAVLHLLAERLYLGRKTNRYVVGLLIFLFGLGLIGGFWLQPKMTGIRQTMYSTTSTPQQKDAARHTFSIWHGVSMAGDLFIIAGLAIYLVRVARPSDAGRYGTVYHIP
jgi:hypothetical protein